MNKDTLPDQKLLDLFSDGPIVLVGEPKSLRGEVRLYNQSQEKITVREAHVRLTPLHEAAIGSAVPTTQAVLSATLQPGQLQHVKLALDIDHHTPPGEYHGELNIGGYARPVVLHVVEVVRLSISPQVIVIDQSAGSTVVKRVIFSNHGNIALRIGTIGSVELGEELLQRAVAGVTGEPPQPPEPMFVVGARDTSRPIVRLVGRLEVRSLAEPSLLQPGEVRAIDMEIQLPEHLEPNTRYLGRAPLYTSDLEFVVVPDASNQPQPISKARGRAHKSGNQP